MTSPTTDYADLCERLHQLPGAYEKQLEAAAAITQLERELAEKDKRIARLERLAYIADVNLCALISLPFDNMDPDNWPDEMNIADKRCLTAALECVREALHGRKE